MARRLVAELRERGWLATLTDGTDPLPEFVPAAAMVRKEIWTGTEHTDGFRAIYAVEPGRLVDVLQALPSRGDQGDLGDGDGARTGLPARLDRGVRGNSDQRQAPSQSAAGTRRLPWAAPQGRAGAVGDGLRA